MRTSLNNKFHEDDDLRKIYDIFTKNYKLFIVSIIIAMGLAFLINRYSVPTYKTSGSILIKENKNQQENRDANDFLNSSLFGQNQNFQNELWALRSSPVLEQTIRNLDLFVTYYIKVKYRYSDAYQEVPFYIYFAKNHPQPINVRFYFSYLEDGYFILKASSRNTLFYDFNNNQVIYQKNVWNFEKKGRFGELIETDDLSLMIKSDSTKSQLLLKSSKYAFELKTIVALREEIRKSLNFSIVDKLATVIEISLKSESLKKGIDIINELMKVYSDQNLESKNHIATVTIDYIEKQLNEISDSLYLTENNLQQFRSSNQLLNITEQANGISRQYMDLKNQLAELVTRKRYYDYVTDYLSKNDNFSNMIIPASLGIQDPLLNSLMSELIAAQAQRSNLIENSQEKNPLVQKLNIQIENTKKTISENISSVSKTTIISIDEMSKRIKKIESEISRLPLTQRLLGNIERKYRLNEEIYNYLLEKRAEAKITKASNLPDDIIIEPAKMIGLKPVFPDNKKNFLIALLSGLLLPFGYLFIRNALNNKIEVQDDISRITDEPVLGEILHNQYKYSSVMIDFPRSNIAESFRALRTNLDFYLKRNGNKVIMVTSCLGGEGKTFVALNLALSYAQLGRRTILVNFDLRKNETYFTNTEASLKGLSYFLIDTIELEKIIFKSPQTNLDYISSGNLPPNPVEIIALEKTNELFSELKKNYEIIILDTAPIGMFTDSFLLLDHSDLKIIISRQNFTLKRLFSIIIEDLNFKKVENICIVLNDKRVYYKSHLYGYGYDNQRIGKKNIDKYKRGLYKYYQKFIGNYKFPINDNKMPS